MIQSNELRIGNKVEYDRNFYDVTKIEHTGNWLGITCGSVPITVINAIPLTPDILGKCGFEHDGFVDGDGDDIYFWRIKKPNAENFYLRGDNLQPQDIGFPVVDYEIKYLHQLQNLYFALTGKELTVNL